MTTVESFQSGPKRIRIALVDDHPIFRTGLKSMLNGERDMQVVAEAGDGAEAIKLGMEVNFDVMLLDVSLPQLGGIEVTQRVMALRPSIKILAVSGHEELAFARMLLEAGARGYALKRSASAELVRAIRSVAAGHKYVDPTMSSLLGARRQQSPAGKPTARLSEREMEVVRLVAQGQTAKEIAASLGLSARTLETYKARAMTKLELQSRADLIRYALRSGWLQDL